MAKLSNIKIVMIAPCQGNFGGIETFCLALIEDLIKKEHRFAYSEKKFLDFMTTDQSKRTKTKFAQPGLTVKENASLLNLFRRELQKSKIP